jgi:hypothetical protein
VKVIPGIVLSYSQVIGSSPEPTTQSFTLSPGRHKTPSGVWFSLLISNFNPCGLHCVIQVAKATIAAPAKMLAAILKDNFFFLDKYIKHSRTSLN